MKFTRSATPGATSGYRMRETHPTPYCMTDFQPESSWIESVDHSASVFRESDRPALAEDEGTITPASVRSPRPAAALAADVHELLESMARKRVPRLDAVRKRLQDSLPALPSASIEQTLQGLHDAIGAVDFMAGRSGGDRAGEFLRQGGALAGALRELRAELTTFLQRETVGVPVTRFVWADLVMESASLRKRVRQGAHWLAEMSHDLLTRRRGGHSEVAQLAIGELARRGMVMHERLQEVHRLCGQARAAHAASECLAAERSALDDTLHLRVLPACGGLDDALQPLLHAAGYRALVPTELIVAVEAGHALRVVLTQACAQFERLRAVHEELLAELAVLEQKALQLTRPQ